MSLWHGSAAFQRPPGWFVILQLASVQTWHFLVHTPEQKPRKSTQAHRRQRPKVARRGSNTLRDAPPARLYAGQGGSDVPVVVEDRRIDLAFVGG